MKKVTLENMNLEDALQLIYNEIAKRNGDESLFVDWGKDFSNIENQINMELQVELVRMRGVRLTKKMICVASAINLNKIWGNTWAASRVTTPIFLLTRNTIHNLEIRNKLRECFETNIITTPQLWRAGWKAIHNALGNAT